MYCTNGLNTHGSTKNKKKNKWVCVYVGADSAYIFCPLFLNLDFLTEDEASLYPVNNGVFCFTFAASTKGRKHYGEISNDETKMMNEKYSQ